MCFTKLVGATLVALMLANPVSARQWWLMEGAAPTEVMEGRRQLIHCPRDAWSVMGYTPVQPFSTSG